jgi:hypothetical protein
MYILQIAPLIFKVLSTPLLSTLLSSLYSTDPAVHNLGLGDL